MNTRKEQRKKELLELLQGGVERTQENAFADEEVSPPHHSPETTMSDENVVNDERKLLDQCRRGNRRRLAFNQFIRRYLESVYNYIFLVMQDREKSFQLTKAVFVKAYHSLPRFRSESIQVWLLAIAEKQLFKATGGWYRAFIPFQVYQWIHTRTIQEESESESEVENEECREIDRFLFGYIGGELPHVERSWVEQHLTQCDRCCLEFERLEQTLSLTRSIEPLKAPAELVVRINEVLDREPFWRSYWESFETWSRQSPLKISQFASVLLLITVGLLWTDSASQQEKYHQLERQFDRLRLVTTRALEQLGSEVLPVHPLIILTGSLAEGHDSEMVADYMESLSPASLEDPLKTIDMFSIPGTISSVETALREFFTSLQEDGFYGEDPSHNTLTIRKLTVTYPKHTNSLLTRFLKDLGLRSSDMKHPFNMAETTVEIHIIDKR